MHQSANLYNLSDNIDLVEGKRVLAQESKALEALSLSLDSRFSDCVDILDNITGRVIVSGMGKSGHVARKIAATLASTGTPAMFVHPAEANHGDLGMIEKKDAVIALSNSGETIELEGMVRYTKRYNIPLIAITGKENSSLAKAADTAIILPMIQEACPLGVAPMTSTTMMMALGDALAAALLCRKKFSTTDFSLLHPGGTLGLKLQKVANVMHGKEKLPIVYESTPMSEALVTMTQKSFGCLAVLNTSEQIMGIITDGDLRRHMETNLLEKQAGQVMTLRPAHIKSDALVDEAVRIMNDKKITSLFVVDEKVDGPFEAMGIIHLHDCLRAGQ